MGLGACDFLFRDAALVHEKLEKMSPSFEGAVQVLDGVVVGGAARDDGEQGRFAHAQRLGALAEVAARGGGDTVGAAAVVGAVQVLFENLLLGECALDAEGCAGLDDFV